MPRTTLKTFSVHDQSAYLALRASAALRIAGGDARHAQHRDLRRAERAQ